VEACEAFACDPWIAVYIETVNSADIFLLSLENYEKKYRKKEKAIDDWKMTKKYRERYVLDPDVKHIRIEFKKNCWFEDISERE
jgi:hypothetical protein